MPENSMRWILHNGEPNRMKTAKHAVSDYINDELAFYAFPDDIYIVWFCKTLKNWKALLSTDVVDTGIYFEVTYNGDKNELYVDHYQKVHNEAIQMEPFNAS